MKPAILGRYGNAQVVRDGQRVYWTSGMAVDADGSPHAYHPDGHSGLDYLANAGHAGNWWGLACDNEGRPYIQVESDPAPGYYVSTTSATADATRQLRDPRRYLDSETVPFVVVPIHFPVRVPLRTPCKVTNTHTGRSVAAIVGDYGPPNQIGEASIAVCKALGVNANPKDGGISAGILFELELPTE